MEMLVRLMNQSLGETYPNKDTTKYRYDDDIIVCF